MARPPKPLDAEQVWKLARIGCTQAEIADILGCSTDTLQRRFAAEMARGIADRRMSLRRAQFVRAVKDRSDKMLIHLGQTELGQVPVAKSEVAITAADAMRVVDQVERALGGTDAGQTPPA